MNHVALQAAVWIAAGFALVCWSLAAVTKDSVVKN